MKFDVSTYFENLSRKLEFHQNLTRITGTLHEDQRTLFLSGLKILRLRNVPEKLTKHAFCFNPSNAELNPICHLLALLGAHYIFHVSGLRVK